MANVYSRPSHECFLSLIFLRGLLSFLVPHIIHLLPLIRTLQETNREVDMSSSELERASGAFRLQAHPQRRVLVEAMLHVGSAECTWNWLALRRLSRQWLHDAPPFMATSHFNYLPGLSCQYWSLNREARLRWNQSLEPPEIRRRQGEPCRISRFRWNLV